MLGLRTAQWTGLLGVSGFVICVVAAHLTRPSLDPASHMISEYARYGPRAVITVGFGLWAISLVASAVYVAGTWPPTLASRALSVLMLLAAVGVVALAAFRTQTSAGELAFGRGVSLEGRLHDVGSGVVSLALFAGACLVVLSRVLPHWRRLAGVALLVAAVAVHVAFLSIGPEVGGLRQRLVLLCGLMWQTLLLSWRGRPDAAGAAAYDSWRAHPPRR